ncbi:MAG: efflux RND transporter permease subunit [Gammaproteobacteria bacterium]
MATPKLGISGRTARAFLTTEITPLLALIGLLLGTFAILITPREEEPQINVTFANVFIPFPGSTAVEVEQLVSTPAEQILSELDGIKHVYSSSRPGLAVLTVQFRVGEGRTDAIVRLYNALYSKQDWVHPSLGVGSPIIKPKGIDDVPIVTLTLWSDDDAVTNRQLQRVAHSIESELKRVPGTRDVYTVGGPDRVVHVRLDPQRLASYGVSLEDLRGSLRSANSSLAAGAVVADNEEIQVQAGAFLTTPEEVGQLVVAVFDGAPVYLNQVAEVRLENDHPEQHSWFGTGPAARSKGIDVHGEFPAVTVAVAKKAGTNAVQIASQVSSRVEQLKGTFIPDNVQVTVTRDYGATADAKAQKLISKLGFATASVVVLVLLALGRREALIVGMAVVVTLAFTLFASWAWGFTLNRVSLFALIFSIGILVDDAIVVVENIHRHMGNGKSLAESIPYAVEEVGGPTILATFTVIAALLPMAFVTGLMGPYMSPIPINASMGMMISLAVAFIITPWLALKLLGKADSAHGHAEEEDGGRLLAVFKRHVGPLLNGDAGAPRRRGMVVILLLLIALSVGLAGVKLVVLKMLPFDNKSEFQVVIDMPEGTPLEQTARVVSDLTHYLKDIPEVTDYQAYVGTASPINFNGLVRQYYLREGANVADIQVNLVDKHHRDRKSHDVARSVREPLQRIGRRHNANVKIVEVPPGPPVMAPLVAEIYGIDYSGQTRVATQVRGVFENTDDIVDVDDTMEALSPRYILRVDRQKAALFGLHQQTVAQALTTALRGEDVTFLHEQHLKYPIPVRMELPVQEKSDLRAVLALKVRSADKVLIPLSEIVTVEENRVERAIHHKDMLPVVYVTGDMAGDLDSPLYGMFDIFATLGDGVDGLGLPQFLFTQPDNPYRFSVKWDGEWQVTFETFRDMGIAYSVGLVLIYLLVVAQFRSYVVPLIIMAPIPMTIIGVMPGHAIMGAQFTATSMIGMIALAGIIVRNSILLVDFINQQVAEGMDFEQAVLRSGAVRAKPIVLTGLAAMIGALFILDDPIFSGLAVSLIFGIFVSTLLTLVVIPVLYYAYMRNRLDRITA